MDIFGRGMGLALALAALTACSGENAEKSAAGAVSKAVELAKGAATGASKGVEEGRKATTSADGARIVTSGEELRAALNGKVLGVEAAEDVAKVALAFENAGSVPVRVTELSRQSNVTALDKDDFACDTRSVAPEFTVPPAAKLKVELSFACTDAALPEKVRIFDVEYPVSTAPGNGQS